MAWTVDFDDLTAEELEMIAKEFNLSTLGEIQQWFDRFSEKDADDMPPEVIRFAIWLAHRDEGWTLADAAKAKVNVELKAMEEAGETAPKANRASRRASSATRTRASSNSTKVQSAKRRSGN